MTRGARRWSWTARKAEAPWSGPTDGQLEKTSIRKGIEVFCGAPGMGAVYRVQVPSHEGSSNG
jgi:hypothetical protein